MGKLVTYVMALSVGLVFAMAVGMPSLLTLPAPQPPETVAAQVETDIHPGAVSAEPPSAPLPNEVPPANDAPPAADNQTLLVADITSGSVTAIVNDRAVGALEAGRMYDLGPFVRPGQNSIRLRWSAPVHADIRVRHSSTAGDARDAGQVYLTPAGTQQSGEQTLTFYL